MVNWMVLENNRYYLLLLQQYNFFLKHPHNKIIQNTMTDCLDKLSIMSVQYSLQFGCGLLKFNAEEKNI